MDVKIEERLVGHVTILESVGRLTIDEAAHISKTRSTASFRRTVFISF